MASEFHLDGGADIPEYQLTRLDYVTPQTTGPESLARLRSLLTADELAQADRMRFEVDQVQRVVARALVRLALSRGTGVLPSDWRFVRNQYGRPEIATPKEWRHLSFSITHTHGMVACLLSGSAEVGIDAEQIRVIEDADEIARRYFSAAESRVISSTRRAERSEAFLRIWTLKESYVKARGIGLSLPLDEFSLEPDRSSGLVKATFSAGLEPTPSRWSFQLHAYAATHIIATAVAAKGGGPITVTPVEASQLLNF